MWCWTSDDDDDDDDAVFLKGLKFVVLAERKQPEAGPDGLTLLWADDRIPSGTSFCGQTEFQSEWCE